MAKEYGFEYELVQYHWPYWLHAQIEKQRVIWGEYNSLFHVGNILSLSFLCLLQLKHIVDFLSYKLAQLLFQISLKISAEPLHFP